MANAVNVQRREKENSGAQYGSLAGMAIGAYYGGPSGAATGGSLGGSVGGAYDNYSAPQDLAAVPLAPAQSSPVARRQQAIESDPATQMRNGKIALASMDEQTRKAFEPVLDEGLRRAAQQRKEQYGYGYAGPQTA